MGTLPVRGGGVLVTASITAQQLAALVAAIDSAISNRCVELTIRASAGNGALIVYVGDASVSSTRHSLALAAGESYTWRNGAGNNAVSTLNKFLRASSGSPTASVDIMVA